MQIQKARLKICQSKSFCHLKIWKNLNGAKLLLRSIVYTSLFLWLYRPVCVVHDRKPWSLVFSCCDSNEISRVMRNPDFSLCENKGADQLPSDQCLCFRHSDSTKFSSTSIKPKFQASSHLLCLISSICVRPSCKPRRTVFSRHSSNVVFYAEQLPKTYL